ncbi:MAG TPA: hypothetical protein GXZ92_06685 [Clostridiales bacterium]|jgi:hypothetical protein|nr:hypothetical protein [Clostridiales bacterium]
MMKVKSKTTINIITLILLLVALCTATFAWYAGESLSYDFDLVADSVFSIYFSSVDVDVEGVLSPAIAMEGAVANGKYMDVTRTYDPSDENPSWVSKAAEHITYWTSFLFRGNASITVSYDWFVSLQEDPAYLVDKSQFVVDVDFFLDDEEIEKVNDKLTIHPIGSTTVIDIRVTMYFAYVDELLDPVLKSNAILTTIDISRIFELGRNETLDIVFDTSRKKAIGAMEPAVAMEGAVAAGKYIDVRKAYVPGNDDDPLQSWVEKVATPVRYTTDFIYTGTLNYLVDYTWTVEYQEQALEPSLFILDVIFRDAQSGQPILPNAQGFINLPPSSTITVTVYMYYALVLEVMEENYSHLLDVDFNVIIRLQPGGQG